MVLHLKKEVTATEDGPSHKPAHAQQSTGEIWSCHMGKQCNYLCRFLLFGIYRLFFFFKNPSNCFMVSSENIMFICWLCDQNIPHGHGLSKCSSTVTLHFAYVWYRGVGIPIIQKFNIISAALSNCPLRQKSSGLYAILRSLAKFPGFKLSYALSKRGW